VRPAPPRTIRHGAAWRDVLTAVRRQPGTRHDIARRGGWGLDWTWCCLKALERAGVLRASRHAPNYRFVVYSATGMEPPERLNVIQAVRVKR
jgi:hypothetical protein